jgi:hypothetical protein
MLKKRVFIKVSDQDKAVRMKITVIEINKIKPRARFATKRQSRGGDYRDPQE